MSYEKSARFYDLFDQKENIEFFVHYASTAGEALDVGAGTGRIAIPLAERGVKVCCVEPSPAMRGEFEKKLLGRPELFACIQITAGDAASFKVERCFPVAYLSGCFDHFVSDKQRIASLQNIRWHLTAGGVLVFDVFLGLMKDHPLSPAGEVKVGDRTIKRLAGGQVLSSGRMKVDLVYEVYINDQLVERLEESGLVGITDRQGVHRVLRETGYEVRKEWSGYGFSPYDEGDSLLVIEAIRK